MYFLSPLYLWALLGLAIPIAIHLWSKKEGKTIKIGSVKLIQEADSKQSSSIQLNEWWLLLLRLLMLALLVLIIAEPRIKRSTQQVPITYLVEASLLEYEEMNNLFDSLNSENTLRLFEKGFPEFDRELFTEASKEAPNYWQLSKELQELRADSIVIFTNAFVSGIKGKRPAIQKNIKWIFLDPGKTEEIALKASEKDGKISVLKALNSSEGLGFETEQISGNDLRIIKNTVKDSFYIQNTRSTKGVPIEKKSNIQLELYSDKNYAESERYLEAAFKAISEYVNREIIIHKVKNKDSLDLQKADAIVWLSEESKPKTTSPILIYKENKLATSLIVSGDSANQFLLTKKINSENSINQYLAEDILAFLALNKELDVEVSKLDKRVMPREQFMPNLANKEKLARGSNSLDISNWFWLFLIPVIITERLLSRFRNN